MLRVLLAKLNKTKVFNFVLKKNAQPPPIPRLQNWLIDLKANIKSTQIKAALAVNSSLIQLYWELEEHIVEKQERTKWGSGFIEVDRGA